MKTVRIAAMLCALTSMPTAIAFAQGAPVVVGQPASTTMLPEGTEITLRTLSELSSRTNRVGDRFNLEVADDVLLNGQVVIPMGSRAVGEVTKVTKKGMFGKSGKLETRLLHVRIGDQQVRIGGSVGDRGKGGTAATVGAMVVIPVAGFFVTGTSALLPPGTGAVGHLEADLPIVFAAAKPASITVPAPVAVPLQTPIVPAQAATADQK